MKDIVQTLEKLTREEILSIEPGLYDDDDLLDVRVAFSEDDDKDREAAIYELILLSPQFSEMIDYFNLYLVVIAYYQNVSEYRTSIRWCLAAMAFCERTGEAWNRYILWLELASNLCGLDDCNSGLKLMTQVLMTRPDAVFLHLNMAEILAQYSLFPLSVTVRRSTLVYLKQDQLEENRELIQKVEEHLEDLLEKDTGLMDQVDQQIADEFQLAVKDIGACVDKELDYVRYPASIEHLLDPQADKMDDAYDDLFALGWLVIPALIQLAYDDENKIGSERAIRILRNFREENPDDFFFLGDWLDGADGDWQTEWFLKSLGKISGFTTDELLRIAKNTKTNPNYRINAMEALVERVEMVPDQSDLVVDALGSMLTRPEAYEAEEEDINGWIINALLDLDADEKLPVIRQVFEEDRLNPTIVHWNDICELWNLPEKHPVPDMLDGFNFPVICQDCGRTRMQASEYVLVDINAVEDEEGDYSEHDPYILDHEVVCSKCGARDRYKLAPMSRFQLFGRRDPEFLADIMAGKEPKKLPSDPNVIHFRSQMLGRKMHPLDGLEEYRRRIALNPTDAQLYSGMGAVLRILMRYQEALQNLRESARLAPDDTDILLTLAVAEHDLGDKDAARQLYQQIIELKKQVDQGGMLDKAVITAMDGVKSLEDGEPSPWYTPFTTFSGEEIDHPSIRTEGNNITRSAGKKKEKPKRKTKRGRRGKKK